jgi:hypothetical protein
MGKITLKKIEIIIKILAVYDVVIVFIDTYIAEQQLLACFLASAVFLFFLFWDKTIYNMERQRIPYPIFLLFGVALLIFIAILFTRGIVQCFIN